MRCVEPFADGGDNARNVAESVLEHSHRIISHDAFMMQDKKNCIIREFYT